jgi:putative inorganic carbon (HCO3(-)) transporter
MGCHMRMDSRLRMEAPLYLAGAAAATTVVSIAAFEILLGLALVWLLFAHKNWRWPPITLPFCLWVAGTLASTLASGEFRAALPQIKKLYVFALLFVVYAVFRKLSQIRILLYGWALGAALSAAWSLLQFARKYQAAQAAHQDFYLAYVAARITGFMGHWMTFSGHMMMALLLIGAFVFFAADHRAEHREDHRRDRRGKAWLIAAGVLIAAALLAAFTRSMWLGALGGGVYLVWNWRRWVVLAIPALLAILLLANPFGIRERALSVVEPHGELDSNQHRVVTRRIGYRMIRAHPWLGLGPEQVGPHVLEYIPADVKLPLPEGYYGHLHNIYIHYAAERGIPAVLALLWMLGQALFDFARAARRLPRGAPALWILHGAIAVIIAILLGGFYELNLGDSEVLGMFLAVLACGYAARDGELSFEYSAPISQGWPAPLNPI